MGFVNAQITLKNTSDISLVRRGLIPEHEIRQLTVETLVDTGSMFLVINKEIFLKLGLYAVGKRTVTFADGNKGIAKMTDPVEIHWEDRSIAMPVLVVDNATKILLGVLPLEGMDLTVDTVNQKLVGIHGDQLITYC